MNKRTLVKWLHWLAFGLMLYFFFVEPDVGGPGLGDLRSDQMSTHAGMGMLLGVIALIWSVVYFRQGPLGRPGPKLPGWGKRVHRFVNVGLYWLLPAAVLTGALAGLTADYPVLGFGIVPLNPTGWGTATLHDLTENLHEIAFDVTLYVIVAHLIFHVWRHVRLKDNALRIMFPKLLHRWL